MQMTQAETSFAFAVQAAVPSFNSVWGNEMQREDFLALAAGVRQISANRIDEVFSTQSAVMERATVAAE